LNLALLLVLAAGAEEIRLASPGLSSVHLDAQATRFYSDHLAHALAENGLHVVTASEMSALLSNERQKQLLGCSETSSACVAELADALGADGIVTGSIGKFDRRYQINVSVLSARGSGALAAFTGEVVGDEALLDELTRAAALMAPVVAEKLGRPLAGRTAVSGTSKRAWALVPAGAAVVLGAVAVGLLVTTKSHHDALVMGTVDGTTALQYRDSTPGLQVAGDVALGVGAACLVAALLLFLLGGTS
jgi:hypothetical protein